MILVSPGPARVRAGATITLSFKTEREEKNYGKRNR
nr:MAG TPA: hypothetical protein [Caudoviricetes sp.]